MTEQQRQAVIAEALTWEGTRYVDRGTIKQGGTDCAMFGLMVYRAVLPGFPTDVEIPKYTRQQFLHRDEEPFVDTVVRLGGIETDTPGDGDFAIWKMGRAYSHGAIILQWPHIIHAVAGIGVIRADASVDARLARLPRFFTWR